MYDIANSSDDQILSSLLKNAKYEILNSYDIHVALFVKYGKKDKEGNLKTPAISKNGIPVPAQIKLVSNFNRITDDTDVKIILNAELWDELSKDEKISTLDNMLHYIQIKEDKTGEPLPISESCDKVQLKLRHPDFYCEGFVDMLNLYKNNYGPWQDAEHITNMIKDAPKNESNKTEEKKELKSEPVQQKKQKEEEVQEEVKEEEEVPDISVDDLINDIEGK